MTAKDKLPISVVIITFNEEKNIRRVLKNLDLFSEVIVLDSYSTDKTVELAEKMGAKIHFNPFKSHVEQKNHALTLAENDWVLSLDADEKLPAGALKEIRHRFTNRKDHIKGFTFPRRTCYLGKWIRTCGWYPNWQTRLFDRRYGKFAGENPHDRAHIEGRCKKMKSALLHFSYDSIKDHYVTCGRYARIAATEMWNSKRYFYFSLVSVRPFLSFLRDYIFFRGFSALLAGYIICMLRAFTVFYKYALLYEMVRCQKES